MTVSASAKRSRLTYVTSPAVYRAMKWTIDKLMHVIYRYQVIGQENIPATGPVIIAINHLHLLDPGAVAPAIPRQIVTLAAEKWEKDLLIGAFLRAAGSIFVRRGEVDREALRSCLSVLSKGGALAVAPEGTRSRTGGLGRGKPGIAYLALHTNATIVPLAAWGVEHIGDWLRLKRPQCNVIVGQPFHLPQLPSKPSTADLQEMADQVMVRIGLMLPPSYRGVYAERIATIEAEGCR
jgi:1-acyl-sn-glycerol-3-phosphate acyltransferase